MIIGIAGRIYAGKDETAKTIQRLTSLKYSVEDEFGDRAKDIKGNYITEYRNTWKIKKFAGKLKYIASVLTGYSLDKFEDRDFKASNLPPEWNDENGNPTTVRTFLQKLGTECVRDNLHTNTWVNALFADYWIGQGDARWIITDCRFPNEYEAIRQHNGIIIKVTRGIEDDSSLLHESETALDGYTFDWIIDNSGDLKHLESNVNKFLNVFNIK
jgi:hypothetical protein